ncbi:MAG: F0F1 ATP synthase subunit A [Candidatus Wildermuthbacteria bacterium]|nr:F0F1 ATP synthase subunit A [Candidatus Wildermuthbacteria bacterium]
MEISLRPEIIATIFRFPVSNSLVLSVTTALLLVLGGFFAVLSLRVVPRKIQNGVEFVVETILDFMTGILGNRETAKQYFPLVASFFLFILFNNWLGVLPGTGSFGLKELEHGKETILPLFRSANSDLNTTFALALISVFAIQWYGIRKLGLVRHLSKFFIFTKGPVNFFVGILEFIAEFAKILSFSFRLFGNVFAGEVLLLIIMTLVPLLAPSPFFLLEFFVGFIQALVFSMLTLIFLKIATETVEH